VARELAGLLVDPLDGAYPGVLELEGGRIVSVRAEPDAGEAQLVFPGFVDLQVYDPAPLLASGVTAYLLATRTAETTADPRCLGLHLEGPFLNPEAAGAIPLDELTSVDLRALRALLDSGPVRLMTLAPELPYALEAIALLVASGAVAAVGHSLANEATARAAVDAGARFATHLWNAMAPLRARATGPVPALLLDERVVLGLIADGRHVHPAVEELTVRVAGPARVALTSDLVPLPAQRADGSLLGGDRSGAALVARMSRFGLAQAAAMAALVPARLLGLPDRGRLASGYRADLAILDPQLLPLETVVAGETAWAVRYSQP
jgi:N-acetylglucosamine-6-phosphate deacetylase